MYKILIIEDDSAFCTNMIKNLSKWNFDIYKIDDFENVLIEFLNIKPHLILMDVNLPYYDGFFWCKQIRDVAKTPIIFLSSRDSSMDIIMAVNQGADDYITKPFQFELLVAKIQALLRRTYDYQNDVTETIEYKGVILDINSGTLSYEDTKIELTKNEQKILVLLMKNKTKVISREKLMKSLWDDDYFVNENTLTVNINRIRNKIADMGVNSFITTKKGEGYIIL
ncbi:MAG: response regulator transcription factor [Clostridiaceae bacterium]|nr:response regulator transcription factor [Clostridiaceae bacterium]